MSDEVRQLIRAVDRATLATTMRAESAAGTDFTGAAYGSLVLMACSIDGDPLLLLSDLADHTKNLQSNPTCSLMLDGTGDLDDPLTGQRITLMGKMDHLDRSEPDAEAAFDRFTARHPSASLYRSFGDFNMYRFTCASAHMISGFGKIYWLSADKLGINRGAADDLAQAEKEVVTHMNEDHADAVALYASQLLNLEGVGWQMTGVDPDGADLRRGGKIGRIHFAKPALNAEAARVELVRLVKQARKKSQTAG